MIIELGKVTEETRGGGSQFVEYSDPDECEEIGLQKDPPIC